MRMHSRTHPARSGMSDARGNDSARRMTSPEVSAWQYVFPFQQETVLFGRPVSARARLLTSRRDRCRRRTYKSRRPDINPMYIYNLCAPAYVARRSSIYENAHEPETVWLIPIHSYRANTESERHRAFRCAPGIDNHPGGHINLPWRINCSGHVAHGPRLFFFP